MSGGKCPGGTCPGGLCPRTIHQLLPIIIIVSKTVITTFFIITLH